MHILIKDKNKTPVVLCVLFAQAVLSMIALAISDIDFCSIAAFIQTGLAVIVIAASGFGIVSIPCLFVMLLYIFHCSQYLLNTLGVEYSVAFDLVRLFDTQTSVKLIVFYIFSVFFFTLGTLISANNTRIYKSKDIILDTKACNKLGLFFVVLCIVPRIVMDVTNIMAFKAVGYEYTFTGERGLVLTWAYGFYIGMLFLIVGNKGKPIVARNLSIVFVAYILVTMFSGRRLEQTGVLAVLVVIYFKYCTKKKIKTSTLIVVCLIGYILLAVVSTMGDLRHSFNLTFSDYTDQFIKNLKGEMISGQLAEFGDSGAPLGYALISFPKYHSFNFGKTYILGWLQVLPNIGGFINKYFAADMSFGAAIPSFLYSNYGSSILGELYFNFGYLAPVMMIIFGFIVGNIARKLHGIMENKLCLRGLMYIAVLPTVMTMVRGSFSDFVRILVYYYIVAWLVCRHRGTRYANYRMD